MSGDPLFVRILVSGVIEEIAAQGEADYPSEACGVVVAEGETVRAIPFENLQDKLHAVDPERYPRTSRDAFNMSALKLARLAEARDLRVIYHSHPDCEAYFSDEDHAVATGGGAEPTWPGVDHLVVSVMEGRAVEACLFRFDRGAGRFEAVARAKLPQRGRAL